MQKLLASAIVAATMSATAVAADLPHNVQAILILKVLGSEQRISEQAEVSIYVKDAPQVGAELKKLIGQKVGTGVLTKVDVGNTVPTDKYSSIYVGSSKEIDKTVDYAGHQDVLSLTGDDSLVAKGISIGMSAEGGRPKFILNLTASKNEGLNWKPSILSIASGGNEAP